MHDFRPIEPHRAFSVLLAAWPPLGTHDRRPGLVSPSLRHEAIVGVARAVFAAGGELVVTGDSDVVPVLAAVALDYAALPTTERAGRPASPLTVVESGGIDPTLRALLIPYIHHDAVRYLGQDGETVELDRSWLDANLLEHRRHPLVPWIAKRFGLRGAIFVSPHEEADYDIQMCETLGVPVAVLVATAPNAGDAERWSHLDPTKRIIGDVRSDRWSERTADPRDRHAETIPFAFVVQRLITAWTT